MPNNCSFKNFPFYRLLKIKTIVLLVTEMFFDKLMRKGQKRKECFADTQDYAWKIKYL
jgi:hypothetical protein